VSRPISRRGFLGLAALAAGGLTVAGVGGLSATGLLTPGQPGALLPTQRPLPPRYQVPLQIPPVLAPVRTTTDTDYYDITQQVADLHIFPGILTPAWTYQGTFPGPTLISRSGKRTVVRHTNQLPHPVVVHLHGGHTPHDSDGYPGDLILPVGSPPSPSTGMVHTPGMADMPGEVVTGTRTYTYPMRQRAATLWYHDHRMGFTGASVYYGLAGFHLITDTEDDSLPLPRGDRDVPIMITDRSFDAQGRLLYPALDLQLIIPGVQEAYMNGVLGDVILVNGAPWPVLAVDRASYRLRLLNASNARRYQLALDPPPPDGAGFVQIGSDGGLLTHPLHHDRIAIAPAERFDVVINFAAYPPGTQVILRNTFSTDNTDGTAEIMRFDVSPVTHPAIDTANVPDTLATISALDPAAATVTRQFLFQKHSGATGWTINGQAYDPGHPLAFPHLGDTEIWRFVTDFHHPIHLHLEQFQILARNDSAPGPYDHGWKDTIDVSPAQSAEIIVKFTDYPGRFVFHCHNLEHEDMAMMANYITR